MTAINLTSTTGSGFLEVDFDQIKDLVQDGGVVLAALSDVQVEIDGKATSESPTFTTSITTDFLTTSEIVISDANKKFVSAPVATYPSLTELSYVKGLSSAVQSQLNAKITSTLAATLDASNEIIQDAKTVTFDSEIDNGNTGATDTIDWNAGQKQKSTLSEACVFTFTAPTNGVGNFLLKAVNFGAFTPTFPVTVLWAGGTEPTWTVSGTDIISFYFDGTSYYGAASLDFS